MLKKKKIKFLVHNVDMHNKGNQALIISTLTTIQEYIPEAEFYLVGRKGGYYNGTKIRKPIGYGPEYGNSNLMKGYYIIYYFFNSFFYLLICCLINIFRYIRMDIILDVNSPLYDYYNCDIFINSGGDSLSGEYGIATFPILLNIFYGVLLKKPIILYGESMGYFQSSIINMFFTFIINRTDLILLRDNLSLKYLEKNNINKPKIYLNPDPAFILTPSPINHISKILDEENIVKLKKPLLGLNPSGLIGGFMKNHDENDLNTMLAKVIDFLIEKYDINVLLVPHVYSIADDDRKSTKKIFSKVKNKFKVKVIKNEYSSEELKGIIGLCDLFIGARMHAIIASTSMLIPTIALAYSHKSYGIIGEMLGQEKYVLDINDLSYEKLIFKIEELWARKDEIKLELEQIMPEIKEKAHLNGKLVKEIVDSIQNDN
jgi:colanic acid/amylovoran biosynthesis protein